MNKSFLRAFVCVTVRDCMVKGGGALFVLVGKSFIIFNIYILLLFYFFLPVLEAPNFSGVARPCLL